LSRRIDQRVELANLDHIAACGQGCLQVVRGLEIRREPRRPAEVGQRERQNLNTIRNMIQGHVGGEHCARGAIGLKGQHTRTP
jgi:hypothetical protein